MDEIVTINRGLDLCYSSDDDGWYFQLYPSGETSQLFRSPEVARDALDSGQVIYDNL